MNTLAVMCVKWLFRSSQMFFFFSWLCPHKTRRESLELLGKGEPNWPAQAGVPLLTPLTRLIPIPLCRTQSALPRRNPDTNSIHFGSDLFKSLFLAHSSSTFLKVTVSFFLKTLFSSGLCLTSPCSIGCWVTLLSAWTFLLTLLLLLSRMQQTTKL